MTEGKREEHPSRKRLDITRVSKDMQKEKDRGQEGGTSKRKTVRNDMGEQGQPKAK